MLVTALLTLSTALVAPLVQASEPSVLLDRGHTDAFYVTTDSGAPVVHVANGIRNNMYDPNDVVFGISSSTYGADYDFDGLGEEGREGYFTASWDASHYFEPGWSAPGFKDNGFASVRIDFSAAQGPGRIALLGNDPLSEDGSSIAAFLADGRFYLEAGTSLPILGHTHAHWFFTHAGLYTLTGQAVAVTEQGEEKRSEPFTVAFRIERAAQDARLGSQTPQDPSAPADTAPTSSPELAPAPDDGVTPDLTPSPTPSVEPAPAPDASADPEPVPTPTPTASSAPAPTSPTATPSPAPSAAPAPDPTASPEPTASAVPAPAPTPAPGPGQATPSSIELSTAPVTLDHGHIDLFNVLADHGSLILAAKDETTGTAVLRDPAWVTLKVGDNTLRNMPQRLHAQLAPRGYYLPENGTTQQEALFLGWDTTAVRPEFSAIDLTVESLSGPGKVFLFTSDVSGNILPSLASGSLVLDAGETIRQDYPAHTHANWLFEAPGTYTMTLRASGLSSQSGQTVSSASATYTWVVGGQGSHHETGPSSPEETSPSAAPTPVPSPGPGTTPSPHPSPHPSVTPSPEPTTPAPSAAPSPSHRPTQPGRPELESPSGAAEPTMCTPPGVDTVLSNGHVDMFNLRATGEHGLDLSLKEDVTGSGVVRRPETVLLKVSEQARTDSVPAGFPGPRHGYLLPQTQDPALVWPGWDTLGTKAAGYVSASFDVTYTGPRDGTITIAQSDAFGTFSSRLADGGYTLAPSGATIVQDYPAHTHVSWLFSERGRYTLTVTGHATRADGTTVSSQPHRYTVDVGEVACTGDSLVPREDASASAQNAVGRTSQTAPGSAPATTGVGASAVTGASGGSGSSGGSAAAAGASQCLPTTITREATEEEARSLSSGAQGKAGTQGAATGTQGGAGTQGAATTTLTFNVGPGATGNATDGHFDLGPAIEDDTLVARIKDDRQQPASWVDPGTLTFALGDAAAVTAPSALSFVTNPGSTVWMIPSTQVAGVPWLGMNSQREEIVKRTSGEVTFRLDSLSGPGKVAVFSAGSLGGGVGAHVFDGQGSSYTLPANTHAHQNWVFTEPGTYRLTLSLHVTPTSGTLKGSGTSASGASALKPTGQSGPHGRPMVEEVVGRTPDGQPCDLGLARTGSDSSAFLLASTAAVTVGLALLAARRRRVDA